MCGDDAVCFLSVCVSSLPPLTWACVYNFCVGGGGLLAFSVVREPEDTWARKLDKKGITIDVKKLANSNLVCVRASYDVRGRGRGINNA